MRVASLVGRCTAAAVVDWSLPRCGKLRKRRPTRSSGKPPLPAHWTRKPKPKRNSWRPTADTFLDASAQTDDDPVADTVPTDSSPEPTRPAQQIRRAIRPMSFWDSDEGQNQLILGPRAEM